MSYKSASKTGKIVLIITAILCVAVFIISFIYSDSRLEIKNNNAEKSGEDYVRILDVGQGDSILIHSNGYNFLIDTGTEQSAANLCEKLGLQGLTDIDVLLLTHLHSDHTGGVRGILEIFEVKNLILPELSTHSEGIYSAQLAINEVTSSGGGVFSAVQGMNFEIGDFEVTVLASYGSMSEENDRSVVVMAEIDGRKFLFTGDAERRTEKALIEEGINLDCDVLKVGHHGSITSSSEDFLKSASAEYAAISVGADNSYGHPHKEIVSLIKRMGTEIYRTDKNGDITFYIENGKIKTVTER